MIQHKNYGYLVLLRSERFWCLYLLQDSIWGWAENSLDETISTIDEIFYHSTATSTVEAYEPQCWKISLIWLHSMRLSWLVYELFSWPLLIQKWLYDRNKPQKDFETKKKILLVSVIFIICLYFFFFFFFFLSSVSLQMSCAHFHDIFANIEHIADHGKNMDLTLWFQSLLIRSKMTFCHFHLMTSSGSKWPQRSTLHVVKSIFIQKLWV